MKRRQIETVDRDGDTWVVRLDSDDHLAAALVRKNGTKSLESPVHENGFMAYVTPENLRQLAELLENPNEPVVTRPREREDEYGVKWRATPQPGFSHPILEYNDDGHWVLYMFGGNYLMTPKRLELWLDLMNNPTEEVQS